MPVAVAKIAQVTMVATASDPAPRHRQVQRLEQPVDQRRALDQEPMNTNSGTAISTSFDIT